MKLKAFIIGSIASLILSVPAFGQTPNAPAPTLPSNFAAGGLSYSPGAPQPVAGTGIYCHLLDGNAGTYACTVVDALPQSVTPFAVNTNVGAAVTQKVFGFGKVNCYMTAGSGVSWSGTNTGFQWNGGGACLIPIKSKYDIAPAMRFLKSSVSNGSGYQVIPGIYFGFRW